MSFRMTKMTGRAVPALALALLAASCSSSTDGGGNAPPSVGAITYDRVYAVTNQDLGLNVTSSDGDPGQAVGHTYLWSASQGTFVTNKGASVVWNPGANPGDATVTVEVSDNIDTSKKSVTITVAKQLAPVLNIFARGTVLTEAESPYVVTANGMLEVEVGDSLIIEPGVEILFDKSNGSLSTNGILRAHGTAAKPIQFGSNKAAPDLGDWKGLVAAVAPGVLDLRHCRVEYAKKGIEATPGGLALVDSCRIKSCLQEAVRIAAPGRNHLVRYTCIQGNNGDGIAISTGSPTTVRIERNRIAFNAQHGVFILTDSLSSIQIFGNLIFKNGLPGVRILQGVPTLTENSIQFNDEGGGRFAVDCMGYLGSVTRIDAPSNFWGTTATDSTGASAFIRDNARNPTIPARVWTVPVLGDWAGPSLLIPTCL